MPPVSPITQAITDVGTEFGLDPEEAAGAAQIIADLPQRQFISDETALSWVRAVCELDPKRLRWHARRLAGFGGSDIGALVQGFRGETDFFANPRAVVASKLMLDTPDEAKGDAMRGVFLEPMIRDTFRAKYGAEPLASVRQAMVTAKPLGTDTDPEWLFGEPDDVVSINGHTYVVDYKAPRPATLEECRKKGVVKFDYACQLHQMKLLAARASCQVDGLLLCAHDMIEWALDVREVPCDPQLEADILAAGNHYWRNCVMQGVLPDLDIRPEFDASLLPDGDADRLKVLSEQYVALKQVAKAAAEAADGVSAEALAITNPFTLSDAKVTLPGATISAKHSLDTNEVLRLAGRQRLIIDEERLSQDAQGYVAEIFEQIKTDLPEDALACVVETHAIAISRARGGSQRDLIDKHFYAATELCAKVRERIAPPAPPAPPVSPASQAARIFGMAAARLSPSDPEMPVAAADAPPRVRAFTR